MPPMAITRKTTAARRHRAAAHRYARSRGGSVLEAAIVFNVLLLLIIFPAMEFGYLFYVKHTLSGAAREGARAAIVKDATSAEVERAIASNLKNAGLQTSATTVDTSKFTLKPYSVGVAAGQQITVDVYTTWTKAGFKPSVLSFLSIVPGTREIHGVTAMRKEG